MRAHATVRPGETREHVHDAFESDLPRVGAGGWQGVCRELLRVGAHTAAAKQRVTKGFSKQVDHPHARTVRPP